MQNTKKKASFIEWVYPPIVDKLSAKKAAKYGVWAALFCSGATVLVVLINAMGASILGLNYLALIDAAIFGAIAFGIYKMYRAAAIIGLVLYLYERVYMFETQGNFGNTFQVVILVFMFINSIRGTFLYHKLETTVDEQKTSDVNLVGTSEQKMVCKKCGSDKIYKQQQCLNCGEPISI